MNAAPEVGGAAGDDGCVLAVRGVVVEYPGVRALDGVDLDVRPGEVHALMGENGAGEEHAGQGVDGALQAGGGDLCASWGEVVLRSVREAEAARISTVHQEIDLIPTMSVADNICLGRQVTQFGFLSRRVQERRAGAALARLGVRLDTRRMLEEYSIARQQMVAIARALDVEARVVVLDEPTSSLDADEARELLAVLRRLRGQGLGIVFITHFLEQVYQVADRITVLRNGGRVGTWAAAGLSRGALVEAMTGRVIERGERTREVGLRDGPSAGVAVRSGMSFERLGRARAIAPVSGMVRGGRLWGWQGCWGRDGANWRGCSLGRIGRIRGV